MRRRFEGVFATYLNDFALGVAPRRPPTAATSAARRCGVTPESRPRTWRQNCSPGASSGVGCCLREMLYLAAHIIEQKSADFEPAAFEDRYENALVELLKSKEAGKPIVAPEAPLPTNVVNLMDALRKSIESEKQVASKKAPSKTSAARSSGKGAKATKAG